MSVRIELLCNGFPLDRFDPPSPPSGSHWHEVVWTPDPDPHLGMDWPPWLQVRVVIDE